jgi:uncharacterized membrane protein
MSLNGITIAPVFPRELIFLLLFLGVAGVIIQYWLIRKKLSRSRALLISLLRLGSIVFILSCALNPFLVARNERKVNPSVAILVDTSPSMGSSAEGGKGSRLDEARNLLLGGPNPLLKTLSEMFDVRLYTLGESLKAIDANELSGLKVAESKGDLTDGLKKLGNRNSLAILLSDGNLRWEKGNAVIPPVVTVSLGDPKGYKDILIKAVRAPALAFRDRAVSLDVTVKSYGYKGLALPVVLKDGNRLLATKNIRIDESPAEISVSLSFTPETVGHRNLQVSIPSQFGESFTSNNSVNLSLKVVRDKIRILMVSGSPSMNYRFMRMALKNDPSIDLLSFVILRTPSDILNVPLQEQSLIPIPVETIFSKELKNFDLLIFDNLPYPTYISPIYYGSVADFVREGGGFAVIGGPGYFFDEGKMTTPIGEMLPIRATGKESYGRRAPTTVKLSRGGVTHPIMQFSSEEGENLNLWREMPALDGINLLEPKSSGTVLLESADGTSRPILTVSSRGKGRVLVLATDYSWKWYMGMVAKGKSNWAYLRFMERVVRWLTRDPSLDPVQITFPDSERTAGREMEFRIKSVEEVSKSKSGVVSLSVFGPDGIKIGSQLKAAQQPGEYSGVFHPEKEGTYKVKIETPKGSLEEFLVVSGRLESFDGAPDHERLKTVSASTGGKSLARGEDLLKEIEAFREKGQNSFFEEKRIPLWSMPYALAVILVLLGTEWYLRRRWGLL